MKRSGGWNQEVTDAQGRRRFHGAFTGGFSAGHFNTVGSEEGWTPSTFVSSRTSRADVAPRRAEDFMDEEDDPLLGKRLETSEAFDTLHQNEKARRLAAPDKSVGVARPIFQVPDELILPMTGDSIGKQLLTKMGWKDGHGIGPRIRRRKLSIGSDQDEVKGDSKGEGDREEVYVPPRNTVDARMFPKPKTDKYGAGFDPYVNAPEFLHHKLRQQQSDEQQKPQRQIVTFAQALGSGKSNSAATSSRAAMGFGLSALEENDDLDVYDTTSMDDFDRAIAPAGEPIKLLDSMSSSARDKKRHDDRASSAVLCSDGRPALEGFRVASKKQKPPKNVIQRLDVPSDFRAYHVFNEREEVEAVTSMYGKFNFSTEKSGRGSTITAKQRAQMLQVDDGEQNGTQPTKAAAAGSVFDLLDPAQREKLMGAAQAVRERKPLTQGAPTEQFRANIMASISKRFVSASTVEEASTDAVDASRVVEKKSYRSEDAWAPHVLLCKRFRVKCEGQTISGGAQGGDDGAPDLFTTELGPHLVDLAASRRSSTTGGAPTTQAKPSREVEEDALPPLPVAPKPSADLLRSIFEPSDESDVEEDNDVGDGDEESESEQDSTNHEVRSESVAAVATSSTAKPLDYSHTSHSTSSRATLSSTDESDTSDAGSNDSHDDGHARKRKSESKKKTKKTKRHRKSSHDAPSDDDEDDDERRRHRKSTKKRHKKKDSKKKHKHRKSSERASSRSSRPGSRERSRSRERGRDRTHAK